MKNTNTRGGCRKILAAAIAAAMMTPQVALADHCTPPLTHTQSGCGLNIPNLNPTPTPNIQVPQITVPTIEDTAKDVWPWIVGGVVVVGLAVAAIESSPAAPGFFRQNGWMLTDELGGIGWSRLLTEKTQFTFASDFPTGKEGEVRAEIKFSF